MISVSRLANRGTEMMKRYCTAAGDSTLVLEKIVQIFLLRFRRSKKLVRKSFKGRFESYSNDCLLFFFVFSFKRGRSSKLAVGQRSSTNENRFDIRVENKEKIGYSFAESMAEFRCTVVTERRSKTNTANNNFSQISRGIVRPPFEIASNTSKKLFLRGKSGGGRASLRSFPSSRLDLVSTGTSGAATMLAIETSPRGTNSLARASKENEPLASVGFQTRA